MRKKQLDKHIGAREIRVLVLLFFLSISFVQAQEVASSIDSTSIKIGEQIIYKIQVDAEEDDRIVFPKTGAQTFMPLEVFDSTEIDTSFHENKLRLKREYVLTQFDSGAYTIPEQKIFINGDTAFTKSFEVHVNDVAVDTTKQNLFPIKPALDIRGAVSVPKWVWWVLGIIVLAVLVYLFLRTRKKIIEKRQELPPYEKAIKSLKTLDEHNDLDRGRIKNYYSTLSEAVKRYVHDKIDDRALESTTSEFITLLRAYKKEKQVYLKGQEIDSLDAILKRADLAKFAGINVDKLTAREDRQTIEDNINAFEQSIPEPTEEEKLLDEEYRLEQEQKQKRKRVVLHVGLGVLVVLIGLSVFISIKGIDYAKDLIAAHPTEKMLQKEWIKSEYGAFGMTLSTPDVLLREMDSIEPVFPGQTESEERFYSGNLKNNLLIQLSNVRFKESAKIDSIDVGDLFDKAMESESVSNITFKNKDFTTLNNEQGQQVSGTFTYENPVTNAQKKMGYTFLVFNERGGLQKLLISYNQGDEAGREIEQRVINSVEFKSDQDG